VGRGRSATSMGGGVPDPVDDDAWTAAADGKRRRGWGSRRPGGEHGDVGARRRLRREVAALGEATTRLAEAAARLRWGGGGAVWGGLRVRIQVLLG
jgi:hypothetical protein